MPKSFSSSKSTTTSYTSLLQFNPPPPPPPPPPLSHPFLSPQQFYLPPSENMYSFFSELLSSHLQFLTGSPFPCSQRNLISTAFQIFNCFYIVLTILPTIPLPRSDSGVVSRVTNTLIFLGDTSFGLLFRKFTKDAKLSIIF